MTDYRRQRAIFNPADHTDRHVTIVGLGNIGSHTARAITQLGIANLSVYDFDTVEEHNLASQAYGYDDIGNLKTESIKKQLTTLNPEVNTELCSEPYTDQTVPDILVCAVDSMLTRRTMATKLDPDTFVVDGRMGGGQIEVHAQYAKDWAATMSDNPDTDPCSARYISYTSYIIAGLITDTVKRHLLEEDRPNRILFHADTFEIIKD